MKKAITALLLFCLSPITLLAADPGNRKTDLFYEGAVFPDAHLAPVAQPYLIFYYNSGAFFPPIRWKGWHVPQYMTAAKHFDVATKKQAITQLGHRISSRFTIPEKEREWQSWQKAGVLPLIHMGDGDWGSQPGIGKLNLTKQNAPFGLSFDEFHSKQDTARRNEIIGLFRKIKKERPSFLISTWIAPFEPMTKQIADAADAIDVFIPETYVAYVKTPVSKIQNRIKEARDLGVIRKTITGLWLGQKGIPPEAVSPWTSDNRATEPSLDAQMTIMRQLAPEMPGVAFFMIHPGNMQWLAEYNDVVYRHFYKPAPTVIITNVSSGKGKTGQMLVQTLARANAETGSPVVTYRFFLDATCVSISNSPAANLNIAELSPGQHSVTVHAVDKTFLTGVDQVEVMIGKSGEISAIQK